MEDLIILKKSKRRKIAHLGLPLRRNIFWSSFTFFLLLLFILLNFSSSHQSRRHGRIFLLFFLSPKGYCIKMDRSVLFLGLIRAALLHHRQAKMSTTISKSSHPVGHVVVSVSPLPS